MAVVVSARRDPAMLFVKRLERASDPWSGHVAFPGGFRGDPRESPVATAQRETEEETGLPLGKAGTVLGVLDDVFPRSVHLPRVVVTPCVFVVPDRLPVNPTSEIELALWVPVSEVVNPANRRPFTLALPTGPVEFSSIHAGGLIIWGLTERVINQIVSLTQ